MKSKFPTPPIAMTANPRALIPFAVFVLFYVGTSIWAGDFYKVPMPVSFLVASATAMFLNRREKLHDKIELFAKGMGEPDIMLMCLIFILAGAFANTAKAMGAVDATVGLALHFIPAQLMLAGLFAVSCLISLSIGTSVGTIAALTPIAIGVTDSLAISPGLCLGVVVGGAMFGDNLSMISDTTIAATRTQGIGMREKFFANLLIAFPPALLCMVLYVFLARGSAPAELAPLSWSAVFAVLPYIAVLVLALCGMNVMALLLFGIAATGAVGILRGAFDFWEFVRAIGDGAIGMSETLIVALLAGGLLKVIRQNGGIEFLLRLIERGIHGRRGGELGIALLVGAVNVFTANNTVAIVIAGPIARDISRKYRVSPARSASLLDTTSCVVQGVIPYGAQLLTAIGITLKLGIAVSAFDVMCYLYYPYLLLGGVLISILFTRRLSMLHNNVRRTRGGRTRGDNA